MRHYCEFCGGSGAILFRGAARGPRLDGIHTSPVRVSNVWVCEGHIPLGRPDEPDDSDQSSLSTHGARARKRVIGEVVRFVRMVR